jgi:hypothetical protein
MYVEKALSSRYSLVPRRDTDLPQLCGYYKSFTDSIVREYTNMKVVVRNNAGPVAVIKAKYFRRQEFPRRVKEEGYVGLTSKYVFQGNEFVERIPGIPFIMFVDMDTDWTPPDYAVRAIIHMGWNPFFSISDLMTYLDSLPIHGNSK